MTAAPLAVGVDVGGTKIAAGLVACDGRVLATTRVPTPARDGRAAVLAAIETAVATVLHDGVVGVGVGTGGLVDHDRGVIVAATDLIAEWAGTPVAGHLSARLRLPVVVDNDGNAFALAQSRFGHARGHRDAVCVVVGTGIGGGLILGGRLRRGPHHLAGELGHLPTDTDRRCSCGRVGHIEAVASGPAMLARYRACGGNAPDLPAMAAAAARGDRPAAAVLADGASSLGRALAGVMTAVDAEIVVVGGGVSAIGERFLSPLTQSLYDLLPHPIRPRVCAGAQDSIVGAASLVFE